MKVHCQITNLTKNPMGRSITEGRQLLGTFNQACGPTRRKEEPTGTCLNVLKVPISRRGGNILSESSFALGSPFECSHGDI